MTPAVFEQFLGIVLRHLSDEDCLRLAESLRKRVTSRNQPRLIRAYRAQWYAPPMSDRAAADEIAQDLSRLYNSPLRNKVAPALDRKRAEAFEILKSGPLLGAERIRKILAGG